MYQKTVDYPGEWSNGYHVRLDIEELVTLRGPDGVNAATPWRGGVGSDGRMLVRRNLEAKASKSF